MKFDDLRLAEPLLRAIADEGYDTPTPIQAGAIPHVLEGRDVIGCAQTGTGKTAAFALPILHRLVGDKRSGKRTPRTLILSPTRELALQIADSFKTYGRHTDVRGVTIYGGVSQRPQEKSLRSGVDVIVATPGRLLDLINQGLVDLRAIEMFVLDEADHMLDMGFIPDIRRIIAKLPEKRQNLLFSATMPGPIRKLADSLLKDPEQVQVAPTSSSAETVEQSLYHVGKKDKPTLLQHVLTTAAVERALVFTRTKHGADRVAKQLSRVGIRAEAIHGNKSQNVRQRSLENFRSLKTPVLIATDVAARGLDIDNVSHVVNYDLPNVPETYVHRIGRTGRAGATGIAVSFCDVDERSQLRSIESLLRNRLNVCEELPEGIVSPAASASEPRPRGGKNTRSRPRSRKPRNASHKMVRSDGSSSGSNRPRRRRKPAAA